MVGNILIHEGLAQLIVEGKRASDRSKYTYIKHVVRNASTLL